MYTFLRVNFVLEVQVNAGDDDVGDDVQNADSQEYLRIVEWYLLGYLHHTKYDDQVGSTLNPLVSHRSSTGAQR